MKTTTKILSVAALATAFALAPTASKAQAGVGVQFGQPTYVRAVPRYPVAPIIVDRGYGFDRRHEFLREQAWQRDHDRRFHEYDRRFDNHRGW